MNATYSQLPNQFTPLAFLPTEMAEVKTNQVYASIGSLAGLIWDISLHIPEDYKLLTRYPINLSTIVYCVSRLTSLAYLLGLVIIQTNPVGNCTIVRNIELMYPFTLPATLLLFVFRTSALYNNNKYVVAFFFLSWLGVLGSSILIPISTSGTNIAFTKYCVQNEMKPYVTKLIMIMTPVNDTLIFFATSWAIFMNVYMETSIKNGFDIMVLGRHVPAFSRSILQNGQAYYLVSLTLTILFTASHFGHIISRSWSFVFALPTFVVTNTMSCHIYRNIRLGRYNEYRFRSSMIDRALEVPVTPELGRHQIPAVASEQSAESSFGIKMDTRRPRETNRGT